MKKTAVIILFFVLVSTLVVNAQLTQIDKEQAPDKVRLYVTQNHPILNRGAWYRSDDPAGYYVDMPPRLSLDGELVYRLWMLPDGEPFALHRSMGKEQLPPAVVEFLAENYTGWEIDYIIMVWIGEAVWHDSIAKYFDRVIPETETIPMVFYDVKVFDPTQERNTYTSLRIGDKGRLINIPNG